MRALLFLCSELNMKPNLALGSTHTLPENSPLSEGPPSLGSQVLAVSSSVNELNTQSPAILGVEVLTQTVLESVRSVRQSLSSRGSGESAGSHTSHVLLVRERADQARVLDNFNPTVALDIAYGNCVDFGPKTQAVQSTSSQPASLLNGVGTATTCPPCVTFPPIFPGIPANTTTKAPTTTLGSGSLDSHGTPASHKDDQSSFPVSVSVWARTGLHYEAEHRGDPNSHFWIPSVQQGAYRTETGLTLGNSTSLSVSASTGIQRDTRNGDIKRSVFTESAWHISAGQLWGNGPPAPLEGASGENGIRTEAQTITGRGGVSTGSQQRTQQHWFFGNTLRAEARAGLIGLGLTLAHTLGSALGGWIGANIGFMAHGLAIGGSAAVSAASAAFNAFTATRADQTVVVTDVSLGLPVRLRFNEPEGGSYLDLSVTPQLRFSSEVVAEEPPEFLEPTPVLEPTPALEMGSISIEMQERPTLTFRNSAEGRLIDKARENPKSNDSTV